MKLHGKIILIDERKRTLTLKTRKRIMEIPVQKSPFMRFLPLLSPGCFIACDTTFRSRGRNQRVVISDIIRIVKPKAHKAIVLFNQQTIQHQTKAFLDGLKTKLFLDLELSMHPYTVDKNFAQEIIQAGYVLVDASDRIIEEYKAFVRPTVEPTLTKRTLKFLTLTQADVDQGIPYKDFYHHFKSVVEKHSPNIIVWGKNDYLALRDSYRINDVNPLNLKKRMINLLELHKNYFRLKNDLGLLNAYKLYGNNLSNQKHDALEDAHLTYRIYLGFKALCAKHESLDFSLLQKH